MFTAVPSGLGGISGQQAGGGMVSPDGRKQSSGTDKTGRKAWDEKTTETIETTGTDRGDVL